MLFGKRRWAVRVVKEAGLKIGSPIAVEAVDLLVGEAKAAQTLSGGAQPELDDLDYVMQAARALPEEEAAVGRLTGQIGLAPDQAGLTLKGVSDAAVRLFIAQGRELGAKRPGRMREPWRPRADG